VVLGVVGMGGLLGGYFYFNGNPGSTAPTAGNAR
jgi:hypothetical protein